MARSDRKAKDVGNELSGAALNATRRRLELARSHVLHQLERTQADAHRDMLNRALAALEQDLKKLS